MRERGLKRPSRLCASGTPRVAPHAGAWIETSSQVRPFGRSPVAPHAGAWIETLSRCRHEVRYLVAPHAGAWWLTTITLPLKRQFHFPVGRTREDPFSEDWAEIERELERDPGLEAVTLFELVSERNPGRYAPGQLRTLQRCIRARKSQHGPEKEIWFPHKQTTKRHFCSCRSLRGFISSTGPERSWKRTGRT